MRGDIADEGAKRQTATLMCSPPERELGLKWICLVTLVATAEQEQFYGRLRPRYKGGDEGAAPPAGDEHEGAAPQAGGGDEGAAPVMKKG